MATQKWAIGAWENRASLTYVPVSEAIGGRRVDAYGRLEQTSDYGSSRQRRWTDLDDTTTTGTTYLRYDAGAETPIYAVEE